MSNFIEIHEVLYIDDKPDKQDGESCISCNSNGAFSYHAIVKNQSNKEMVQEYDCLKCECCGHEEKYDKSENGMFVGVCIFCDTRWIAEPNNQDQFCPCCTDKLNDFQKDNIHRCNFCNKNFIKTSHSNFCDNCELVMTDEQRQQIVSFDNYL